MSELTDSLEVTKALDDLEQERTRAVEKELQSAVRRVGPYLLKSELGAGGCATVFLAQHQDSEEIVALKLLGPEFRHSPEMLERFTSEAKAAAAIAHPAIVRVRDTGNDALTGQPYIAMEYLQGRSLSDHLRLHQRFSPAEVLRLLEPVCGALSAAHRVGIVHRDLKGSNVMVVDSGEPVTRLVDFGIAKFLSSDPNHVALTRLGARLGTSSTMAPEQIRGSPVDARTDIYSLGVLLYVLLVGEYPFRGATPGEVERKHLEEPAPRPSRLVPLPASLDEVVLRCMEKAPARRFATVEEFLASFRAAVSAAPVSASASLTVPAVALLVDARLENPEVDAADEVVLGQLMVAMDTAEGLLRDAGLTPQVSGGTALLAVELLQGVSGQRSAQYQRLMDLGTLLVRALQGRGDGRSRVHFNVVMHLGSAPADMATAPATGPGSILEVSEWAPPTSVNGIFLTPPCAKTMPPELSRLYEDRLAVPA